MDVWVWMIGCVLVLVIVALLIKIHLLRKAVQEIQSAFEDRLTTDTNTLIDISSGDPYMRRLASSINTRLRSLRAEHNRFVHGDMELKRTMANITHDLRTPLTAILSYLDLLDQEEKSETVGRYIGVIRGRAEMMVQLAEELFLYSVIVTSEDHRMVMEQVTLNHILEESIATFYTPLKERKMRLSIQMPEQSVVRTLDRSALARVFSNLLSNAVKYSDGDLEITLTETGEITFTNTASQLSVVQVGKLFDRFYTVETARKSTGLGLAIAKALVEQMGGSISAKIENNKLSICILLPETNLEG